MHSTHVMMYFPHHQAVITKQVIVVTSMQATFTAIGSCSCPAVEHVSRVYFIPHNCQSQVKWGSRRTGFREVGGTSSRCSLCMHRSAASARRTSSSHYSP